MQYRRKSRRIQSKAIQWTEGKVVGIQSKAIQWTEGKVVELKARQYNGQKEKS